MASPTTITARNAVRHEIRDGMPSDGSSQPFEMVRLEALTDQIAATPGATYQLRFDNVPTQRYITVQAIPGTLTAYLDGSWTPTRPTADVDANGNFTLPSPPASAVLVTYGWQYFSDGAIDQFVDEARQWLREFPDVTQIPDGLAPALHHYAAMLALRALARQATLAAVRGGDAEIDLSKLGATYLAQANALEKTATTEREVYYSRGPEKLAPAVSIGAPHLSSYTPRR